MPTAEFTKAAEEVKSLAKLTNDEKLALYALFKVSHFASGQVREVFEKLENLSANNCG